MSKRFSFTIDRKTWSRGADSDDFNLLLDGKGDMCCLGFYMSACGASLDELRFIPGPEGLNKETIAKAPWLVEGSMDSQKCRALMYANDRKESHGREEAITSLFAREGIDVLFEG